MKSSISNNHRVYTIKPALPLKKSKKTKNWFSRQIIAKCRSRVLQNAPIAECSNCRMLQDKLSATLSTFRSYFAILSTFIKLPFVFKTIVLSIFDWPLTQIKIFDLYFH